MSSKQTPAPNGVVIYQAVSLARQMLRENADLSPEQAGYIASIPAGLDAYWRGRVMDLARAAEEGCRAARERLSR